MVRRRTPLVALALVVFGLAGCADFDGESAGAESANTAEDLESTAQDLSSVVATLNHQLLQRQTILANMQPGLEPAFVSGLAEAKPTAELGEKLKPLLEQYGRQIEDLAKASASDPAWVKWVKANSPKAAPPASATVVLDHFFRFKDWSWQFVNKFDTAEIVRPGLDTYLPKGLLQDAAIAHLRGGDVLVDKNAAAWKVLGERYPALLEAYKTANGDIGVFRNLVSKLQKADNLGFCRYGFAVFVALIARDLAAKGVATYEDQRRDATQLQSLVAAFKEVAPPAVTFGFALRMARIPAVQRTAGPLAMIALAAQIHAEGLGKDSGERVQLLGLAVAALATTFSFGSVAVGGLLVSELGKLWHEALVKDEERNIARTMLDDYNQTGAPVLSVAAREAFAQAPYGRFYELRHVFSQPDLAGPVTDKIPWVIAMGDHSADGLFALYKAFPKLQGTNRTAFIDFLARMTAKSRRPAELELLWQSIGTRAPDTGREAFCDMFQTQRDAFAAARIELCPERR